ncbi:ATP-binding cassette domain-containing protein [Microvirga sp. BT689]|uniref:ABC transporter ATP-binding protein n=1 Tax=Microvirga arvi TaxID=2778731 RepID=UPI0019501875|nr:oligopeptide/dipeptide ABC transporter ATP-binding protein [Microvirga arvi]MBM6581884.1 ATP-binding cassette domain-containing protein [Microvirga arvi]
MRSRMLFGKPEGVVQAVDGVSFDIRRGETLGLVGESGCGKTTIGRAILQLNRITEGSITFDGKDLSSAAEPDARRARRRVQLIFQDPYASLNPRMSVGRAIAEPIRLHGLRQGEAAIRERVHELLVLVGLAPSYASRYPHEFSGGQRQRIGIARALACEPELIVCDEPVSALDVSIQAQVVNLLQDLQEKLGLTYLFIAHGLSVIQHISDRVAVMYLGRIAEIGERRDVYGNPRHPYTRSLLSAVPIPNPKLERARRRIVLNGELPSPLNPPKGCRFVTRCPIALERCSREEPPLAPGAHGGSLAACWRSEELDSLLPRPVAA